MCTNQIARPNNYHSYNVLGMVCIFVFGFFITLLNLTIYWTVERIRGHTIKGRSAMLSGKPTRSYNCNVWRTSTTTPASGQVSVNCCHERILGNFSPYPRALNGNEEISVRPNRDQTPLSRSFSRGWSRDAKSSPSPVVYSTTSSISRNDEPAIPAMDPEKGTQVIDVETEAGLEVEDRQSLGKMIRSLQ
jgi:hypothetical protein